jgi:integrase
VARLTTKDCERLLAAGVPEGRTVVKHSDGGGLYLVVRAGRDTASWLYRSRSGDKNLGSFPDVVPKAARDALVTYRAGLLATAADTPRGAPRVAASGKAFPEVVREWLAVAAVKWADKTRDAAERALLRLPLASKPINAITTDDVRGSLMPLPDRQRQDVRQNLARVLKFASGREWVEFGKAGNPAVFKDDRAELWPKFEKSNDHHARVSRDETPALYASIIDGDTARALRFLILTAARTGDVEGAIWSEIHRKGATFTTASGDTEKLVCEAWIIPAERTKERQRRIVPLPSQAMAILGERGDAKALLFGKLPANAMLNLLKKTHPDKTVHGMRSTFRDWAVRQTVALDHGATMRDLAELQQGHKLPGASTVERAYARDGLYDLRAPLMDKWASFVTGTA